MAVMGCSGINLNGSVIDMYRLYDQIFWKHGYAMILTVINRNVCFTGQSHGYVLMMANDVQQPFFLSWIDEI